MTETTRSFVTGLLRRADTLPADTLRSARELIVDVLGVGVAGSTTPEGRALLRLAALQGGSGRCSVLGTGTTFDPATSALLNGTMVYSIGLTDTHSVSITHPGPSVVPAALAVGQHVGATDEQILRAIVLGVETVVRIGAVVNPSHRARGFHPTATCNPFGAAVAACYLLGTSPQQALNAVGIVGSMSGGLYEFRHEGSMLMALHGGWPAYTGITAARLALEGFTGPSTVLEGSEGFFTGFADVRRLEKFALPDGDQPWGIQELGLRPYNACRYAHAGIDALAEIEQAHGSTPLAEIDRIIVWTHRTAVEQECEPTSLVAARLSTAFTIALTFLHGPRLGEMTETDLQDRDVLDLLPKVEIREDPRLTAMFPARWACRVQIDLADGKTRTAEVLTPKGEPDNPLTEDEIVAKFDRLAGTRMSHEARVAVPRVLLRGAQAGDQAGDQAVPLASAIAALSLS